MSKASEWAANKRPVFVFDNNEVAYVTESGGIGFRHPPQFCTAEFAIEFGRWLLDTFGEREDA